MDVKNLIKFYEENAILPEDINDYLERNCDQAVIDFTELERYEKLEEENEKLKKSNRILSASIKRTSDADWKNKFYDMEEYQKEVDSMETNLMNILEDAEIKDKFGETYNANDSEVRYYDVPDIVESLIAENKKLKEKII